MKLRRSTSMRADLRESAAPGAGGTASRAVAKSRRELYEEARKAGIAGRSTMNKQQLIDALREHRAARVAQERARPRGPDRCAIVYEASGRYGEFQVVVTEMDGSRRSVVHSPAFRARRFGGLRRRGAVRAAHELLVSRLEACGWWPVEAGGAWHELEFVRLPGEGTRRRRSLVTVVRERGEARFLAEELDSYGKPTPLMVSEPFDAPRFGRVRPSKPAKAALEELLRRLESKGWKAAGRVGDEWYAIALSARPR
jgi:hypothetical protein